MALAALDIGAYSFMRLYDRAGRLQVPGLLLANNDRAERLLSRVPRIQRLRLQEAIGTQLIALGSEALARGRSGTTLLRIDELLLQLASDDEDLAEDVISKGFAVDRISNGEAVEDLIIEISLAVEELQVTMQSTVGGAPRDNDALRVRLAGVLLWSHLTGTVEGGPITPRDPEALLGAIKENGVPIRRAFNPNLTRQSSAAN